MPEKQINRKKAKALPEKVSPLSFILSTLLSFAIFYSYIDTYYDKALQLQLFITCAVVGALLCLVFFLKDKAWGLIPLSAVVIVLMLLIFKEDFRFACQDITQGFIKAYNNYMYVPIDLSFIQHYRMNGFVCIFLLIHFWVLLWNTCWKWPLISVLPGLGLLAMGIVTNEYPNFIGTALMSAVCFGLLSLKNTKSVSYALSLVAGTVAAALVINFTLLPLYNRFTHNYSRPLISLQSKIIEDVKGGNADKLMSDFLTAKGEEIDLNDEEIDNLGKVMLTVTSNEPVTDDMYLKGFVGAEYTGFSWVANNENEFLFYREDMNFGAKAYYEAQLSYDDTNFITVKYVGSESRYVYAPYYSFLPDDVTMIADNYLMKEDRDQLEFDFIVDDTPTADRRTLSRYSDWVYEKYLDMGPLKDSAVIADIVESYKSPEVNGQITGSNTVSDKLGYISGILSSYRYTKTPPATPEGEDYIEHFLGTSKAGYCQHFASSAVMLCRAMGIPARYVTGYAIPEENFVSTSMGYYYSVPDYLSHAWFEVYLTDVGWVKFDFTPASALSRPGVNGIGGTGAGEGDEPALPESNSPEEPYNYFNYDPEEEFLIPEKEVELRITIDFLDFVPIIIGIVIAGAVIIFLWSKMANKFERYRVGRYDFSTDESRRLAIDRNFRALEFCIPARGTDDDYSYMDYALKDILDEEEIKLYKAILQENSYGNSFSFDEKEVIDLMKRIRNKLIYSLKPVKQFIFLYILCY